jgi:hypothetical protein
MNTNFRTIKIRQRFVIDTTTLISYFSSVFQGARIQISQAALELVANTFKAESNYLMIIPSIVFVEIFDKWFRGTDQEFRSRFRVEVYEPIRNNPNIEVREIDVEILETLLRLDDSQINLENRDKLILAAAQILDAPLITSDRKIQRYFTKYRNIPSIIT